MHHLQDHIPWKNNEKASKVKLTNMIVSYQEPPTLWSKIRLRAPALIFLDVIKCTVSGGEKLLVR